MTTHTYRTALTWSGSTTDPSGYDRSHEVVAGADKRLRLSADPAFRGDGDLLNPEELVVAAASSCQLLTFLAVSAAAGVSVVEYDDESVGEMPDGPRPVGLTGIALRPRISVRGADAERVRRLVHKAHEQCFVANSLSTPITVEPTVEVVG